MKTLSITANIILVLLAVIASTNVSATEIYHWVDEKGVQHFSQYAPGEKTPNVSKEKLVDTSPPNDGKSVYDVEAHEESMAAWREEQEERRKEAREYDRNNAQQQKYYQPTQQDYSRRYWYPPIYNRPPYRPPHKPPIKPEQPIERPTPPSKIYPRGVR